MTISPDLACMRIGNTEHRHGIACSCVLSRPLECRLWAGIGVPVGGQLACRSQCTQQRGASHCVRALSFWSSVLVFLS